MSKTYLNEFHRKNQMVLQEYLARQKDFSQEEMEGQTRKIQEAVITQMNISRSHSLRDILNKNVEDSAFVI